MQAIYPEYVPDPKYRPHGYWTKQRQKEFFDRLAIKYHIQRPEDWNKVSTGTVLEEGGQFIKYYYNTSLKKGMYTCVEVINFVMLALKAIYPEYVAERMHKPKRYWADIRNQKDFFDNLAIKLNIQKPEDWYRVTSKMVVDEGGTFVSNNYGGSLIRGNYFLYWY